MSFSDIQKYFQMVLKNFSLHETALHASAFTYTAILSLPALILSILFITKTVIGNSDSVERVIENAGRALPGESGEILASFLTNSVEVTGFFTGIITIGLLLYSGTKLITFFTGGINNTFGLRTDPEKKKLGYTVKIRLFGLIFIVLFIGVIFASIIVSTVVSLFIRNDILLYAINFIVTFCIYTLLYAFVIRYMTLIKITYSQALGSGAFVAFLTIIAIALITFVLNSFDLTSDFAIGASIILLLLWINFLSLTIFFGFECINVYLRANDSFELSELAKSKYGGSTLPQNTSIKDRGNLLARIFRKKV